MKPLSGKKIKLLSDFDFILEFGYMFKIPRWLSWQGVVPRYQSQYELRFDSNWVSTEWSNFPREKYQEQTSRALVPFAVNIILKINYYLYA